MIGKKTSFSKKRRENVIVERSVIAGVSEDEVAPPIYPKSQETQQWLNAILKSSYVFQSLSNDEVSKVVDMMCEEKVPQGHLLIEQGSQGDYFYVVESGTFDVLQVPPEEDDYLDRSKMKKLGQVVAGGSFGELA